MSESMPGMTIHRVGDGVTFVEGAAVNWVILTSESRTALIDTGYPGDWDDLCASLRAVGREAAQVDSVYVTHGHVDHIGSAERLRREHDAVIYATEREGGHVRREYLEQVGIDRALKVATTARGRAWLAHVMKNGGLSNVAVAEVAVIPDGAEFAAPVPIVPIVVPGHTTGHTAYYLPSVGALVTGDALVTGHPLSTRTGPQMLADMFHHDVDLARRSLSALIASEAVTILPGHGPMMQMTPAEAISQLQ
jgi:glyoxylase-like metal-dependent hydrolase (beta-lactamase superfamily II)